MKFSKLILIILSAIFWPISCDIGLPVIQFNTGDDNDPEIREEVHLDDFFWTGSGDGPPDFIQKVHTGISKGKDVIVKTETVVATVYVEGHNEIDIPICLDCEIDSNGIPLNYSSTDRRYWLLTVISGFHLPKDTPLLEHQLAKLYRLAFTRQQSKHLGLANGNGISTNENLNGRDKRHNEGNITGEIVEFIPDNDEEALKRTKRNLTNSTEINSTIEKNPSTTPKAIDELKIDENLYEFPENDFISNENKTMKILQKLKLNPQTMESTLLNDKVIFSDGHVRVIIHNMTMVTEEDLQQWADSYDDENNEKFDQRPFANQTEIIYSVLVSGKPVLAATAAQDMKLVSEKEVETIMRKSVFMKAEPYLKEPQATPLVPSTKDGRTGVFALIEQNSLLVGVSSIAILLLLLLVILLFIVGRTRTRQQAEIKRLSSGEGDDYSARPGTSHTNRATIASGGASDDGVQNFGYEDDTRPHKKSRNTPNIEFPLPPPDSRRGSITSSSNTSDSSVYCPINPPNADLQRMLNEKAATLFEKKKKYYNHGQKVNKSEPMYTSVISAKKREKLRSKHKTKRRYMSENRVGSINEMDTQSSGGNSNDSISDNFEANYDNFEHAEAFNPHNNYHRNKVLQNRVFTDKVYDIVHDDINPTEAINREIIKALQPGEKSSETGSIGSFLSMQSVKSFPKNLLPEPLHRVLEPVSVTYYDNLDESLPRNLNTDQPIKTVATIERKPSDRMVQNATQSDNQDPGVLGPIVWEIHKNAMNQIENDNIQSPVHDPAASRNRFEGLLEGAMQMYSSQDDLITPLPTNNFGNSRNRMHKDHRGKSALVSGAFGCSRPTDNTRPSTAQPDKTPKSNQSTQPPSPNNRAWGSGSQTPLVRPLSAGPFHRPEPPAIDVTRVLGSQSPDKSQLSAAPLIEAIQNELKKFKRENSQ